MAGIPEPKRTAEDDVSECRMEFVGEQRAALLEDDAVVASATGADRSAAVINLWAMLLAERREDLAAVVAREHVHAALHSAH